MVPRQGARLCGYHRRAAPNEDVDAPAEPNGDRGIGSLPVLRADALALAQLHRWAKAFDLLSNGERFTAAEFVAWVTPEIHHLEESA